MIDPESVKKAVVLSTRALRIVRAIALITDDDKEAQALLYDVCDDLAVALSSLREVLEEL